MHVATTHIDLSTTAARDRRALDALRSRINGEIVTAESPGCDRARGATFLTANRHPLALVRPAGEADVAVAVAVARAHALPPAVRGGGHSPGAFGTVGGAFGRVAPDGTAFAHRQRRCFVALIHVWLDLAANAAPREAWAGNLREATRGEGRGVYVNSSDETSATGCARPARAIPGTGSPR